MVGDSTDSIDVAVASLFSEFISGGEVMKDVAPEKEWIHCIVVCSIFPVDS